MKRLARILEKNFLLVWRSKGAISIILFGPLLMAFLIGIAFGSSYTYLASVGIYEAGQSELGSAIRQNVANAFEMADFDSAEECINGVRAGSANICLVLPQGLAVNRSEGANEVEIYADSSRTNLVWAVLESLSASISETSSNISLRMTEELVQKLYAARTEIANDSLLANSSLALLSAAGSDSAWLKDSVSSLKTNADASKLAFTAISSSAKAGYDELSVLEDDIGELVKEGRESLDDARQAVDTSSANSSQKAAIKSLLDSAKSNFNSIASSSSESKNSTESAAEELNSTLSAASDEAERIKEMMAGVVDFKQNGFSKLAAVYLSLNEAQAAVSRMSLSFDRLISATAVANANASYIVTPIVRKVMSVSPAASQLKNIFPALLVIVVVFTSLMLSSAVTVAEKGSKAFFRNSITPADELEFILAGYATNLAIISLQLVVFVAASVAFLNVSIAAIGNSLLLLFLIATVFVLCGMAIGEFFSSQEGSIIASLLFGSLLLFFSNTLIPLEGLPQIVQAIAAYNPFVVAESLLRKAILHSISLAGLLNGIFVLLVFAAVVFAVLVAFAKFQRARTLRNYQGALPKIEHSPACRSAAK